MPSFSFAIPIAKESVRRVSSSDGKYTNVLTGLIGVVCITKTFTYFVEVNGSRYPIIPENYDCEFVNEIYEQQLTDHFKRIKHIRLEGNRVKANPLHYLPFAPGLVCTGKVVKDKYTNNTYFKIKKVVVDPNNEDAKRAFRYYKENYAEISAYRQKLEDEENERSIQD